MKRKLSDCSSIGKMMVLIGLMVAAPAAILPFYPQDLPYLWAFLLPGGGSILLGLLSCRFGHRDSESFSSWHTTVSRSSLTVLFVWLWGVLIGALPFVFGHQLTMVQALFEAVSGWTTTGLSAMDVSITPMVYLFHRSFMQYCGGLGFVMMMIVIISNKHSMDLYSAEGHPDKLMPNLKKTSRAIFVIYNVCLVLGTIAYRIAGMTWFDGVCHAMCSLSTGGFSTKLASIGAYNSLSIEIITIVLMLIGTTNFAALLLFAKGKFKSFFRVSEVRFMFGLLGVFIPITALSLADGLGISFLEGLRKAAFDVVSALSTSGYSTMSYAEWPALAIGVLILMMFIGGGIGSTAGGLKISRAYLMLRMAGTNIKRRLSPRNDVEAPYYVKAQGKTPIDKDLEDDTFGFFTTYLVIYIVGSLLITVTADCTLTEAMFDFASSLGTVGLSIGITGPMTNNATLIVEMIGMLLGRLEIFIVFTGIVSGFKNIRSFFTKKQNARKARRLTANL